MTCWDVCLSQDRKLFGCEEEFDAAGFSGCSLDEAALLELDDHLMDGGWGDTEVALHVGLGGRLFVQTFVGVDEGQILALLVGEAGRHGCSTGS